ncbi:chemotaxis response regulator protein-glutamate methylesterase [Oceanobacillus sp. Castelsardo]|uniref:protein-glutamate methylesterase/protein-glutamine glutaminase n=1 Tax=Oceanobacillus sp. Castelsardo TaxID=1851204 RepID=UPI0008390819|nr:chemotaxis response regulator protein-glutamate methylesterase [Oceanobacillus sp. Castelsardo]
MERIRVIVIDDSAFMRKIITDILSSDERIDVISTARNGMDGIKKIEQFSPDVVTMDVQMPIVDGIQALEILMEKSPLPVIMLSGETEDNKTQVLEAMAKGAVDFIAKPSGPISLNMDSIKNEIISKVVAAASIRKIDKKNIEIKKIVPTIKNPASKWSGEKAIVAIGSSTGGPRALAKVINDLPGNYSFPILIVQHMPAGFTKSLANRLNMNNDIYVKEAEDGEQIKSKTVYIAPGNQHMRVQKRGDTLTIQLAEDSPRNGHRPSVDVLFESLAELEDIHKIAVILTGMGSDGTQGILKLKEVNENTVVIAESEETAIIYGMPKAVINSKKVNYILPINQIGEKLQDLQKGKK